MRKRQINLFLNGEAKRNNVNIAGIEKQNMPEKIDDLLRNASIINKNVFVQNVEAEGHCCVNIIDSGAHVENVREYYSANIKIALRLVKNVIKVGNHSQKCLKRCSQIHKPK
jgi:hypothetical protein